MRLVCANSDWLAKYQEMCEHRNLPFSPWPSRLALLAAEGRELVAGVMAYDTSGAFVVFEHLVTNETAPLRMRWAAVDLMAGEILAMCRVLNKLPMILVRSRGIASILKRHGLQSTGAVSYGCAYSQLEKHDEPLTASQRPYRFAYHETARIPPDRVPEDNPPLRPPVG